MKHTPGPWEVEPLRKGAPWHLIRPVSDPEQWIAQVPDPDSADARLIAAAPDMLEELELIVAGWTNIEQGKVRGRKLTEWETERLQFARAAIARVKE